MQNESKQKKIHYIMNTKSLELRPYCKKYVKEYHQWFQNNQELLYLTGSQPLSLEQQYQNHKSWLQDPAKYTFLVFTKKTPNQPEVMIGDVNLFFSEYIQPNESQINVMIARKEYRGKGYAKQIMQAVQLFALGVYKRDTIIAKIKNDNHASIKLFERIGYQFVNESQHFQQKQFRKTLSESPEGSINKLKAQYNLRSFSNYQQLFLI